MSLHESSVIASRFAVLAILTGAVASCADDGENGPDAARVPVIFDYSPTLSDADALLYLASNPAVELLAVTLPGTGEADCEPGTRTTRALLKVANQAEVPVGCGSNDPLLGDRDWPDEWRAAANELGDGLLPDVAPEAVVDAEQLLADTLRTADVPVTVIAVGPLTNLGAVLGDHPELSEKVAHIVIMGGALDVPGNVADAPAAEWNIYIDPEAARVVIASGVPVTFVALDATNYLAWTDRLMARIDAVETDAAETVHALATARPSLDGFYLWDELAAMTAVNPSLVTTEAVTLTIDGDGALTRDPAGYAVEVAITADTSKAMDEFVKGLNRGAAPSDVGLTAAELDYMVTMGGVDSRFGIAVGDAYEGVNESDPDTRGMATSVVEGFIEAVDAALVELRDVSAPASLTAIHEQYLAALTEFVAARNDLLSAVTTAEGADLNQLLNNALADSGVDALFGRIKDACQALVSYSFLRDGPRPCSPGG